MRTSGDGFLTETRLLWTMGAEGRVVQAAFFHTQDVAPRPGTEGKAWGTSDTAVSENGAVRYLGINCFETEPEAVAHYHAKIAQAAAEGTQKLIRFEKDHKLPVKACVALDRSGGEYNTDWCGTHGRSVWACVRERD